MLVRVAMIEGEARGAKSLELCRDFGGELAARLRVEEYDSPKGRHVGTKHTLSIHEMSHGRGGSTRRPSTSTRCRPTRKEGMRRARAIASPPPAPQPSGSRQ